MSAAKQSVRMMQSPQNRFALHASQTNRLEQFQRMKMIVFEYGRTTFHHFWLQLPKQQRCELGHELVFIVFCNHPCSICVAAIMSSIWGIILTHLERCSNRTARSKCSCHLSLRPALGDGDNKFGNNATRVE